MQWAAHAFWVAACAVPTLVAADARANGCGDASCGPGETACSCPDDCEVDSTTDGCCLAHPLSPGAPDCGIDTDCACPPGQVCIPQGAGFFCSGCGIDLDMDGSPCDPGETFCKCPLDCEAQCGDGCCTGAETNASCPADCLPPGCRDGDCGGDETCVAGPATSQCGDPGEDCACRPGEYCDTGGVPACRSLCGNGVCDPGEDDCTCDVDCLSQCGDGCCTGAETPCSCPEDGCGDVCGDGCCSGSEDCTNCGGAGEDCECAIGDVCVPPCGSCGNGICDAEETFCGCPGDCPSPDHDMPDDGCCTPNETACTEFGCADSCGDLCCSGSENPCNCPEDGPSCAPFDCGDGCCTGDETDPTCDVDCVGVCGDGYCGDDEDTASCPADCSRCGDRVCAPAMGEDCLTCIEDCGCPPGQQCAQGSCEALDMGVDSGAVADGPERDAAPVVDGGGADEPEPDAEEFAPDAAPADPRGAADAEPGSRVKAGGGGDGGSNAGCGCALGERPQASGWAALMIVLLAGLGRRRR